METLPDDAIEEIDDELVIYRTNDSRIDNSGEIVCVIIFIVLGALGLITGAGYGCYDNFLF